MCMETPESISLSSRLIFLENDGKHHSNAGDKNVASLSGKVSRSK